MVLENSVTKNPYSAVKVLISVWMQTFSNHTIRKWENGYEMHDTLSYRINGVDYILMYKR